MADYLTTAEVARYLRINQKKVYDLVSRGELPAARISGKWLFPRHLVDQWVAEHTVYPGGGRIAALADEMLVMQGSDDWLLERIIDGYQGQRHEAVPRAAVGSLAGISAIAAGHAHLAGCHVSLDKVRQRIGPRSGSCILVRLFGREQGLILDRTRHPEVSDLASAAGHGLRFAARQPESGTYVLVRALVGDAGLAPSWTEIGPYATHLEVALAVRRGLADVGVGIRVAAEHMGLDFVPLCEEPFSLAVPGNLIGHQRVAGFLGHVLDDLALRAVQGVPGYRFEDLGRLVPVNAPSEGG